MLRLGFRNGHFSFCSLRAWPNLKKGVLRTAGPHCAEFLGGTKTRGCLKNARSGGTAASGVKTPDTKRPLTAGLKPRPPEDKAFFSRLLKPIKTSAAIRGPKGPRFHPNAFFCKLLKPNVYRGSNVGAP